MQFDCPNRSSVRWLCLLCIYEYSLNRFTSSIIFKKNPFQAMHATIQDYIILDIHTSCKHTESFAAVQACVI